MRQAVKYAKAIIPIAGPRHRDLPLQQITTGDGVIRHVVTLHVEELLAANIEQVALIVRPGTEILFQDLKTRFGSSLVLIQQPEARGFGDAVLCAETWVDGEAFVLGVCDHIFVTHSNESCTRQLLDVAAREDCSVSGVQVTGESQLPYFGVIGGHRVRGLDHLYEVATVLEKPTPTVAEQQCVVPGLRQGTYLAFFGVHALTSSIFRYLRATQQQLKPGESLGVSESLDLMLKHEKYLAFEVRGHRIDLEGPFGLLRAQLGLALHGANREDVLRLMLEEVAHSDASLSHVDCVR